MSLQITAREAIIGKALPLCMMCLCALVGVYGLGHQNDLSSTQADILSLQFLGSLAAHGTSPYSREVVQRLGTALPFPVHELFYPPSFLAFLIPLANLNDGALRLLTALIQIACTVYLALYITRLSDRLVSTLRFALYNPLLYYALFQTVRFGQLTCVAVVLALLVWNRRSERRNVWWTAALLCGVTMKPSIALGLLCFLLLERNFALLLRAGFLHLACLCAAALMSGLNALSLLQEWLGTLAAYRDYAVNSPTGPFVYGVSTALERISGVSLSLDLVVLPAAYLIWKTREHFSQIEILALLLAAAFIFGTPHAYDFYLLIPAFLCFANTPARRVTSCILMVLMILPQRLMTEAGFVTFDSVLRVVIPLVLYGLFFTTRVLERIDRASVPAGRDLEIKPATDSHNLKQMQPV